MYCFKNKYIILLGFREEGSYENCELHGSSKSFNGKGELLSEGQYKRGKKTGIWKFYENNKLIEEKNFTYVPKLKKNNN